MGTGGSAADDAPDSTPLTFTWQTHPQAVLNRLEIETETGEGVHAALVPAVVSGYRAPPWLGERASGKALRWRVAATDAAGRELGRSEWRRIAPGGYRSDGND